MTMYSPGPVEAWRARPYPQLLRGPNMRWWRPLLSLAIASGVLLVLTMIFVVVLSGAMLASGLSLDSEEAELMAWQSTPAGLLVTNLFLAGLIVVAQLAVWGGFGWRPRWVSSVRGGLRWTWLVRAAFVSALSMIAINLAFILADGGLTLSPEPNAALFALVILLTTPLQAAGEEYFFRGWMSQAIGSWFPSAALGAVVAALVSATVFAILHGIDQNAWLWLDRFAFGLVASWLVWRTGGLEAAVAMHVVNNVITFAITVLTGNMDSVLTITEADPVTVVLDIALFVGVAVLLDRLARRWAVQRNFRQPIRFLGEPQPST